MARPKLVQLHCHDNGAQQPIIHFQERVLRLALAGQPNVGKSTVFNMLTGLNQHVGNWPGKTVERKVGVVHLPDVDIELVDLPGTYSLTANSLEERIARDYIIHERPDAVIVIVNAAALEHGLYLVAELLQLPTPLVIGLNMLDVAERNGMRIEPHVLEAALGIPVIPLIATRNQGVRELVEAARRVVENADAFTPRRPGIRSPHEAIVARVRDLIAPYTPEPYPVDWVALKLLEGDSEITELIQKQMGEAAWSEVAALLHAHEDAFLDIAGGRYEWIERMTRAAVVRPSTGPITLTDRLDRIATHPLWGLILLSGIFGLTFWLTYTIAAPVQDWLDAKVISPLAMGVQAALAKGPSWLAGLLVDGLIGGVGTVLTFLPVLTIFFAVLGLLEDVGYLARAAYVMDRFMHLMGLHGKSFLPLFLGFGCNVPAVMGARIIEDHRSRLMTILLAPLVPCTARLAVVAFLAPAFFGSQATLATWGLVTLNILTLALLGTVIHRLALPGGQSPFIMELPLYHMPNWRTIGLLVWHHTLAFIRKAGTIILLFSVLIWTLSHLPSGDVEQSFLAWLGRLLAPIGYWMGWPDWRLIAALLSSFAAKENTIATLGILYRSAGGGGELAQQVASVLTPAGALSFLAVQMLFIPCAATMATIRQETSSWRWGLIGVGLLLVMSLAGGLLVYRLALLAGLGA
ncbi:MAG: ferrous iron transport protein B [Anaerolineae bacterium]|nr:ferrous iron transport protein B [Anaerolineae bacterium]MDW8097890.1 ferrous iron transport protein B [Anaerolineae bacterium]